MLHAGVTLLLRREHNHSSPSRSSGPEVDSTAQQQHQQPKKTSTTTVDSQASNHHPGTAGSTTVVVPDLSAPCACCSDDPVKDLESLKTMAHELEQHVLQSDKREIHAGHGHVHNDHCCVHNDVHVDQDDDEESKIGDHITDVRSVVQSSDDEAEGQPQQHNQEEAKLMRMSINTAVAIGLHNFPEGLATFVATLNNPSVGAVLAVAIAIHNIPLGLCVAMPVYYATGKRWQAFWGAVLSSATGPLAAFLGWLVLAKSLNNTVYGILFGVVAGILVAISVRELLPTAHRYDPEDSVVTYCFIAGMAVMALSLVLFMI
jgi:zinc transporter ZupT